MPVAMSVRRLLPFALLSLACTACGSSDNPQEGATTGAPGGSNTATNPGGSGGTSSAPAGSLTWTPCEIDEVGGFECTDLQVPLDHAKPTGPKITLALARKKHTDPDYRGVILSNPGGPGSAGKVLTSFAGMLPKGIGKKYDWIGIDVRGTGDSKPTLDCIGDEGAVNRLPYLPKDDAQIETWKSNAKRIAQSCAQGPGKELLPHLHTSDIVKDFEAIRKALGVEKVTFWGSSYGSYLGMMYATMYPGSIEKMALDGVVSPTSEWYASNLKQQKALGTSFGKFVDWVAQHNDLYQLGSDAASVRKKIQDKLDALRQAPDAEAGKRNLEQVYSEALEMPAYGVSMWGALAMTLKMLLVDKNDSILGSMNDETGSGVRSVYLAVTCSEAKWPAWDKVIADAKASHQEAPLFSWLNTWFNSPCAEWTVPATPQPKISAQGVQFPILLMSETFDGATPFDGALEARRLFPSSSLVEGLNGTTHSGTLSSGKCFQDALFDFFSQGKLPARVAGDESDKKCDPVQPDTGMGGGLRRAGFPRAR